MINRENNSVYVFINAKTELSDLFRMYCKKNEYTVLVILTKNVLHIFE